MKHFKDILPKSVIDLSELFVRNGKSLYVVGGSIRDFLMGHTPNDFDLCTNATPEEILNITDAYKKNMQGASFGVIVVYTDDNQDGYEIATFRSDIYDGKLGMTRNPDIKFSTIEDDSKRRDLTINALYYDIINDKIIDFHNGINDLKNGIIKMVGDPDLRILEDKLRSLRAIRFASRYNYKIDNDTLRAISNSDLINISKERIWDISNGEVMKAFDQVSDIHKYFTLLFESKLIYSIFDMMDISEIKGQYTHIECYIADMFGSDLSIDKLIQEFKIESTIAKKAKFLINLSSMTEVDVYQLYKTKTQLKITNELISDFLKDDMKIIHKKFIKYKPTVSSFKLMEEGFSGKALGDEILRREIAIFEKYII